MQTIDLNGAPKTIVDLNPIKGLGAGFKFGFGASYVANDFISVDLTLIIPAAPKNTGILIKLQS